MQTASWFVGCLGLVCKTVQIVDTGWAPRILRLRVPKTSSPAERQHDIQMLGLQPLQGHLEGAQGRLVAQILWVDFA